MTVAVGRRGAQAPYSGQTTKEGEENWQREKGEDTRKPLPPEGQGRASKARPALLPCLKPMIFMDSP